MGDFYAKVVKSGDDWGCVAPNGDFIKADNNAAAWRLADKLNNEATSRAESVSDWIISKEANKGAE